MATGFHTNWRLMLKAESNWAKTMIAINRIKTSHCVLCYGQYFKNILYSALLEESVNINEKLNFTEPHWLCLLMCSCSFLRSPSVCMERLQATRDESGTLLCT